MKRKASLPGDGFNFIFFVCLRMGSGMGGGVMIYVRQGEDRNSKRLVRYFRVKTASKFENTMPVSPLLSLFAHDSKFR